MISKHFSALFDRYIEKVSIIITDNHASYPGAVLNNQFSHLIVNHSQGFKNIEGFHTNNIENLWSLLKYERAKRRGVLKSSLEDFLLEFKFRYKYLRKNYTQEIFEAFSNIITFLLSEKYFFFIIFVNPGLQR
ncbi:hypothetical protein DMUE_5018 [Dictyocoela muelleri]|nr:hypothetical protein DMUE_5018 [Dictyocoela muelleri]